MTIVQHNEYVAANGGPATVEKKLIMGDHQQDNKNTKNMLVT